GCLEVTMNHATFRVSTGRARTSNLILRTVLASATLGALFLLASCTAKQAPGQHATIFMRDGTTLSGTVTATSPTEVTLTADDNASHTVPMTQVKSIEYDDAAAPQTSAGQTSAANSGAGATPTRRASNTVHEHHYHPTQAEIHTKTYVLPAGTKVPVRTED